MKERWSKAAQKEMAKTRIQILFNQAESMFSSDESLASRYISLARRIAMRTKVRMPLPLRRRFCKHCYRFLMPGVNSRVRTRGGKVIISCFECKKFMRIPIRRKKLTRS